MTTAATIQHDLRPFLVMRFFVGLGVYPIQKSKPETRRIVYLSILYSLIIWFGYDYLLYYTINFFTLQKKERLSLVHLTIIDVVTLDINIFNIFTCVIMNFYYEKVYTVIHLEYYIK